MKRTKQQAASRRDSKDIIVVDFHMKAMSMMLAMLPGEQMELVLATASQAVEAKHGETAVEVAKSIAAPIRELNRLLNTSEG